MNIMFSIDMDYLRLRNISLFLGGLVVMKDGLDAMMKGLPSRQASWLPEEVQFPLLQTRGIRNTPSSSAELLETIGSAFIGGGQWPTLPQAAIGVISQSILSSRAFDDIQLISLSRNSLDGVLEDLGTAVGEFFRRLFGATRYIVKGVVGPEIRTLLEELESQSNQNRVTKRVAMGVIIIGIDMVRRSYAEERVTYVEVRSET